MPGESLVRAITNLPVPVLLPDNYIVLIDLFVAIYQSIYLLFFLIIVLIYTYVIYTCDVNHV